MRIRFCSDLHLEFQDWVPPAVLADVVVLAGDIDIGTHALAWARRHFADTPIIYVAGNHEFFGEEVEPLRKVLRDRAQQYGLTFLDGEAAIVNGVRFLGATLWTDFALYGDDPVQVHLAMRHAQQCMYDYQVIKVSADEFLTPEHTRSMHQQQIAWLAAEIKKPFPGPTVVVTHHLPHLRSVHEKYAGASTNPAFASDLSHLFGDRVRLWIHGHTHESFDYCIGSTRVVCNPRGYIPQEPNAAFDPVAVVEI